jgi:hypothetical protein
VESYKEKRLSKCNPLKSHTVDRSLGTVEDFKTYNMTLSSFDTDTPLGPEGLKDKPLTCEA